MFTGIIEEVGSIRQIRKTAKDDQLHVAARKVLEDVQLGDSIAVNGVCLTVVSYTNQDFVVDVMPETIKATSLKQLENGSRVNLERAMAANGRFGGHIVSGHVDTVGKIVARRPESNAVYFRIQTDAIDMKYLVPKGSITVDGISLTVMDVQEDSFTISIIPHTLSQTNLKEKQVGSVVNLEFDVLAKYMERLLLTKLEGSRIANRSESAGLTKEMLAQHGYL